MKGPVLFGVDLQDAREEVFVRMVCDGLSLGVAYMRAGFPADNYQAASVLFALPRIQERAAAIMEARRTTGVVTLEEVTDMLKRVYAGAVNSDEYSAAHNAAFSLARLYGHVTDRATVEVIRRPSRDPDAPSEQALTSWVESLPGLPAPGPASPPFGAPAGFSELPRAYPAAVPDLVPGPELPARGAPAPPLEFEPAAEPASEPAAADFPGASRATEVIEEAQRYQALSAAQPLLDKQQKAQGETGNGAPTGPVTGTPNERGRSDLLGSVSRETEVPLSEKRVPSGTKQVPAPRGKVPGLSHAADRNENTFPPAEDLF